MIDPLVALTIFITLVLAGFFLFRPGKGYFWAIKRGLTRSKKVITEDILKQLYHIEYAGGNASLNDLVGALHLRHNELIDVLSEMEVEKLITSVSGKVKLTLSGSDYALRIIRAHRLLGKVPG